MRCIIVASEETPVSADVWRVARTCVGIAFEADTSWEAQEELDEKTKEN